jgi:hypothetical protein
MFGYRSAVSWMHVSLRSSSQSYARRDYRWYHHANSPRIVSFPEAMYDLDLYQIPDIFIELLPVCDEFAFSVIDSRLQTQH